MANEEAPESFHVTSAGLVICHPFLPRCFEILDYLNGDNQFKDEASVNRAVYLLHYMATGVQHGINEFITEELLFIPKVLCGLPYHYPIDENTELNEQEIETAESLLEGVISNWEQLGETSIQALRETFMMRYGLVELEDGNFRMTIGKKGTDILLDFIPWNIDLIKLPWMEQRMEVTWRE